MGNNNCNGKNKFLANQHCQITQCLACLHAVRRAVTISIEHEKWKHYSLGPHIARIISPILTKVHHSIAQCHRIASTPLPWIYVLHVRFVLMVLLFFLPFRIIAEFYDWRSATVKIMYNNGSMAM